jgi:hypothetical protein
MTATYQSRWGFHPCDYATYLQLRRIHKAYWQARRKVAAQRRWARKLPQNRRDPEPMVPAVLRELHAHPEVVAAFQQARRPRPWELVVPLGLGREVIDRWLVALLTLDDEARRAGAS